MPRTATRSLSQVAALFLLIAALVVAQPHGAAQVLVPDAIVVNEVVADNTESLLDVDGDSPDWIELANPTNAPVDVGLSYLSDSSDDPARWQFPAGVSVPAGGYLVVFASGKDRAIAGQELHTDFSLSSSGEEVVLTAADGVTVVDRVTFSSLDEDVSFGRSGADLGALSTPTPGGPNSGLLPKVAAAPRAETGNSLVEGSVVEQLTSATAGAVIRYTLDGSLPSLASAAAPGGQVTITPTSPVTTLRAAAFAAGYEPSAVSTFTYIEPSLAASSVGGSDAVGEGIRSLSVMSVTTAAGREPAGEAAYEPARIDYIDPDGAGFSEEIGLKHFGNASLAHAKKSFRVNFSRDYGAPELDYPLFADRGTDFFTPATKFDQLEIRGYAHDGFGGVYWAQEGSYIANEFGRLLSLELGSLNTHGRPITLFVDGTFRGLYQLRERLHTDWMSEYLGGDGDDYESWVIDDRSGLNNNNAGDGSILRAVDTATSYSQVKDLVNPVSFIASALVMWNHSFYWEMEWRVLGPSDPDHPSGLHLFPNDLDLGFGGLYDPGRSPGLRDYLAVFDDDPEFLALMQAMSARAFCGNGPMTEVAMLARFDGLRDEIRAALAADVETWNHGSVDAWNQQGATARANIPSGIATTRQEWEAAGWFLGCDRLVPLTVGQSSVYGNNPAGFGPRLAVDARFDNFTSTDLDAEARFDLDLGSVQSIDSIKVWNRANCCPERLSNFHVFVADEPFESTTVAGVQAQAGVTDFHFPGQAGASETFAVNAAARYVRIQLADENYLSLGEVEVFGNPAGPAPVADAVILNEWNAVDSDASIEGGDIRFGSVLGNGGDWFELVVIEDRLDLRGYRLQLSDADRDGDVREITDTFVLSDAAVLADLRAGTIVTVAQSVADELSYNPAGGDWTINLQANSGDDGTLVTVGSQSNFDSNNGDWQLRILDRAGRIVSDWTGEGIGGVTGIGSTEVGELEGDPVAGIDRSAYGDGDSSTFGAPNRSGGLVQDFRSLRGLAPVVAADVEELLDALAGKPGEPQLDAADLDGDGELTLLDALFAARRLPAG